MTKPTDSDGNAGVLVTDRPEPGTSMFKCKRKPRQRNKKDKKK